MSPTPRDSCWTISTSTERSVKHPPDPRDATRVSDAAGYLTGTDERCTGNSSSQPARIRSICFCQIARVYGCRVGKPLMSSTVVPKVGAGERQLGGEHHPGGLRAMTTEGPGTPLPPSVQALLRPPGRTAG